MGFLSDIVRELFERPLNPLSRWQAFQLRGLCIDGLNMEPDKKSLKESTDPKVMYAFYNNMWVGTAYGSRFEPADGVTKSPEIKKLISKIELAYIAEKSKGPANDNEYLPERVPGTNHLNLTRWQEFQLKGLPIDGIELKCNDLGATEVFYEGLNIGTAYGDTFEFREGALCDFRVIQVANKIQHCYEKRRAPPTDDSYEDADIL